MKKKVPWGKWKYAEYSDEFRQSTNNRHFPKIKIDVSILFSCEMDRLELFSEQSFSDHFLAFLCIAILGALKANFAEIRVKDFPMGEKY